MIDIEIKKHIITTGVAFLAASLMYAGLTKHTGFALTAYVVFAIIIVGTYLAWILELRQKTR